MLDYLWLVLSLAIPFLLLYGLGRLSRWHAGRSDPIDTLISAPRWCKDKAGYMIAEEGSTEPKTAPESDLIYR